MKVVKACPLRVASLGEMTLHRATPLTHCDSLKEALMNHLLKLYETKSM